MSKGSGHAYRREIDGLRAVAVLPVILFHAGFAGAPGGYVGVDIFFVISGYLITSLLIAEQDAGKFSLLRFYERRARRILPALFLVMAACLPFAWFWMNTPHQLKDFARSLVSVTVFASNIMLWRDAGYFDLEAELKPLLHTWSLAVEEQYYLAFPLLLALGWKLGKKRLAGGLALLAVVSFGVALYAAQTDPTANFYLAPTRGWELLMGALLAFKGVPQETRESPNRMAQAASLLGLAMILIAIGGFNKFIPAPSAYTLAPTAGAALIIYYASPNTWVGRLLSHRWPVGIGLLSYSIYLWHQPLLAFARLRSPDKPGSTLLLAVALGSILLAYFSWRYVEQPFRDKTIVTARTLWFSVIAMSVLMIALGLAGYFRVGFSHKFYLPETLLASFKTTEREGECFNEKNQLTRPNSFCQLQKQGSPARYMVFGDSHARSLLSAFEQASALTGINGSIAGANGCLPLLSLNSKRRDSCTELNQRVLAYVRQNHLRQVFLVARWAHYLNGGYEGAEALPRTSRLFGQSYIETSRQAFLQALNDTLAAYNAMGIQPVFLAQAPQQLHDAQAVYYRNYNGNDDELNQVLFARSISFTEYQSAQQPITALFAEYTNKRQLKLLSLDQVYCEGNICPIGTARMSYYTDDDHLSFSGARRVVPELVKQLQSENE